ncbi:MAG TPA: glycine cleavage T C-terminal barrel domain-containing protein [Isosphaeraceae bacterium]
MTTDRSNRGYAAAARSVAIAGRSDRVRIELTGPDRAKVLHNLTTNDIKRLTPGRGCEAFLTSGQGRTLALLLVHAEDDRLLIRSDPETAGAILGHLGKYGMFEDATTRDVSAETSEWHLVGPLALRVLEGLGLQIPEKDLDTQPGLLPISREGEAPAEPGANPGSAGASPTPMRPVRVIRDDPMGLGGLTILSDLADAPVIATVLRKAVEMQGGSEIEPPTFETLRIEAGTPVFGKDVTPANLPQEANRDARAISFVKGCYLGQETVARLDAMGHVNKILIGAVAESDIVPPPGATLEADGKAVGTVTSSAFSPGWSRGVILGYVKTSHASPGSAVVASWDGGTTGLLVHAWPIRP